MLRKLSLFALALLLGLAPVGAETAFKSLSVTQTVGAHAFAASTRTVTIVSDGTNTCFFRLFNNRDTAGNATTADSSIKSGESLTFSIKPASTDVGTDSQGSASSWKSISAICSTGQTATWRIYSK